VGRRNSDACIPGKPGDNARLSRVAYMRNTGNLAIAAFVGQARERESEIPDFWPRLFEIDRRETTQGAEICDETANAARLGKGRGIDGRLFTGYQERPEGDEFLETCALPYSVIRMGGWWKFTGPFGEARQGDASDQG